MKTLSDLPNIGKITEEELNQVGIYTPEQLIETGSKEAYLKIRQIDPGACLHLLYGLEGAVEGIRYTKLSDSTKEDLKEFFNFINR